MPTVFFFLLLIPQLLYALEVHDAHIHYNQDMWKSFSPQQALQALEENNIQRAIVSSTPAEGTKKLHQLQPEKIIPFLRPYRVFRDRFTWHSDPEILKYVTDEINSGFYQGLGEFHLFREHKNTDIVKKLMALLADKNLIAIAHSDGDTIKALISMQPQLTIIWAHCGMKHPIEDVMRMLDKHKNLYCELSFREHFTDENGNLNPNWKILLESHPTRFLTGMDTYIARRWANLPEIKEHTDHWLMQVNEETRKFISQKNMLRLFPITN